MSNFVTRFELEGRLQGHTRLLVVQHVLQALPLRVLDCRARLAAPVHRPSDRRERRRRRREHEQRHAVGQDRASGRGRHADGHLASPTRQAGRASTRQRPHQHLRRVHERRVHVRPVRAAHHSPRRVAARHRDAQQLRLQVRQDAAARHAAHAQSERMRPHRAQRAHTLSKQSVVGGVVGASSHCHHCDTGDCG